MTEAERDRTKTDAAPDSTWGASGEAKAAWDRKHGPAARKAAGKPAGQAVTGARSQSQPGPTYENPNE